MFLTLNQFDTALRQIDYSKNTYGSTHNKSLYFKAIKTETDYRMKFIVVIDLVSARLYTEEGVEALKQWVCAQFEYATPEDVLVVGIGTDVMNNLKAKNFILCTRRTQKVLWKKTSEDFKEEFDIVKSVLAENKRIDEHVDAAYGPLYQTSSQFIVYIIIALTMYAHFSLTNGNGSEYGISAVDVFKNGDSYRLITYMFTHGNLYHLVSNCFSLFLLGKAYAKRRNAFDFSIVYLGSGILSGIISISTAMLVTNRPESITVGASGAVFAILGALVMNVLKDESSRGARKSYVKYAALVIVTNLFGTNVDHVCHIAGFLSGMLLENILVQVDTLYYLDKFIKTSDKRKVKL